ncbi:xanthine dehydrogenase accessory protein XdhC [uncultured Sulfitobacter sp.]|uniref:xanthine dehydrogenase accessory protein XdhC n=1 Tax=uncultured Sulfitobacter sp. TaxID=191468 RepID=UPI002634D612|nr:xanthine dehydrogenase accessory protein XdhC [uncultured Sulfitobacter sp.]
MAEAKSAIYIEITATRGSTPRNAGTGMTVTASQTKGTIGGGALEYQAIATARRILATDGAEQCEAIPLGPNLGQCCGGSVTLLYTYSRNHSAEQPSVDIPTLKIGTTDPAELWIWGAGHVGRAVVKTAPPQGFKITWIDTTPDRFPSHIPPHVTQALAANMPLLASRAPTSAHHLIFTYSHEIDLALCAVLLKRGAASTGLIGSQTKWARFSKRLREMNLDPSPIICPIGDKSLGKHPDQIAHGTVRTLICDSQAKVS